MAERVPPTQPQFMTQDIISETIHRLSGKISGSSRNEVLDSYISAIDNEIKDLKKKAKTVDLNRISWLYHSMHELKLCKNLDESGVASRIKVLKPILNGNDADDAALALASLTVITEAGKRIRKNT